MLRFPEAFSVDEKTNEIIKKYMNQKLIDLMNDIMISYCGGGYDEIKENDEEFIENIDWYFPENYPRDKMVDTFLKLYALLKAEDEFIPELVMEYLMDAILSAQVEVYKESGISLVEPIPDREYVLEVLKKEFGETTDIDAGVISGVDRLHEYEDLGGYLDYYFWDVDFELLNTYTEEEIRKSLANKECGIVDINKKENTFIIPKEWTK
ncbi:MAG: hypothetical protein WBI07_22030 [Mobilitalea sp.]